jgi:hypothetical protein
MEGGVLGALALTGTHPATALTAVIVYRVAGYWAPGAAGAVTAALLTRRHPAPAARPVTPLRPQAPAWPPSPCGGRPAADHPDSAGPDRGARTRTSGHRAALKSRAGTRSRSTAQEHVMIRSHHQQHQLQRIETGLLRSDPQLTAMLGIFGKLSAGQAMPAWEQVPATRRDRIRQTAALTVQAITLAAAAIGLLLSAVLALLIVVVGTRHSHRLPASGPERTRRSRGSHGRSDPAGQRLRPMSTSTLMAGPAAARRASRAPPRRTRSPASRPDRQ